MENHIQYKGVHSGKNPHTKQGSKLSVKLPRQSLIMNPDTVVSPAKIVQQGKSRHLGHEFSTQHFVISCRMQL